MNSRPGQPRSGRRAGRTPLEDLLASANRSSRASVQWGLRTADFDYELPPELIAQRPLPERSAGRMLVVDRQQGSWTDARVRELPRYLNAGDCLVVNNSRVLAARLRGRREPGAGGSPGGAAEILVLGPEESKAGLWSALVRPSRRLREGSKIIAGGAEILMRGHGPDGIRFVEFPKLDEDGVLLLLESQGRVPLPPYIRREDDAADRERYQTLFAREAGSVAAPTAGLHFDEPLLAAIRERGATIAEITLHVGLGTFRPVAAELVEEHRMHAERYDVRPAAASVIREARRTVAVGTTCVRALESMAAAGGGALRGATNLFIVPGFQFRSVDALLTNFHLPRSTLVMLVAAFAGRELVREAYAHAVRERYRFYSYGDCMLIL